MKILVTGATGFIGSSALELLLRNGHEVLSLSRSFSPKKDLHSHLFWIKADLSHADSYRGALNDFRPESCLHLAWQGIPDYSLAMSLLNLNASAQLVQILLAAGCRHFVFSGSCWEYGSATGQVGEEISPVDASVFGSCKHALHHIVAALCHSSNAVLAWARVFYPYGPRQKATSLVPTVCRAIAKGEVPVLRNANVRNDFVYVDDTAEALVLLVEKLAHGVFNVGSGYGTPAGVLADELLHIAGQNPIFEQAVTGGIGLWADITKLHSLGWESRTPLSEGLRHTLKYFTDPC